MLRRLAKAPFGQQIQQVIWDILMARQLCSAPVDCSMCDGNFPDYFIASTCIETQLVCAGCPL